MAKQLKSKDYGNMEELILDGFSLTIKQVQRVAHAPADGPAIKIHPNSLKKMRESREFVSQIAREDRPIYSINTGFGMLSDKKIDKKDLATLQYNLIRSHCTGVGPAFNREIIPGHPAPAGQLSHLPDIPGINPDIVQLLLNFSKRRSSSR